MMMHTRARIGPAGDGRIPVTVLTGALGAGKTTVLRQLVAGPDMLGVALLINEFGRVGIDHHLLDSVDETTMLLDSGCLCCTIQGGLVQALQRLSERSARGEIQPLRRVLIETTGLADPVPVVQTLMQAPFVAARYLCDGVVTVVDATQPPADLQDWPELLAQVTAADRLLLSKADAASSMQLAGMRACLHRLAPGVPVVEVRHGRVSAGEVFASGTYAPTLALSALAPLYDDAFASDRLAGRGNARQAARHRGGVDALVVDFPAALPWAGFALAMGRLLQAFGPRLLRAKGLLRVAGESGPVVVQCVRGEAFPALKLACWPETEPAGGGQLVCIVRDHDAASEAVIREALLAPLPGLREALRTCLVEPGLPTRGWLRQRIALQAPAAEHAAWWVHARHLPATHG